jgi:hypothetical protein
VPPATSLSILYGRRLIYVNAQSRVATDAVCASSSAPTGLQGDCKMLDALLVAAGVAFFAIAIAYVTACDRM